MRLSLVVYRNNWCRKGEMNMIVIKQFDYQETERKSITAHQPLL